ncbi:transporter substrate-binding domain-containing protein [Ruficoccus sp. ZRK36]|uniref:transporter substrate-binding domain-containing protein n=1 Tax=Ruficoccus sp. ZRK36 TaxID=2866311 RepID=UPI001C73C5A8|nr:transporter substrate-binding domain-containing protein [Ruficoccus sp. ZRK36]QYY37102.1 transporter substrate-binding domain-containing protein [Ruficoccus sp. ZRK36]
MRSHVFLVFCLLTVWLPLQAADKAPNTSGAPHAVKQTATPKKPAKLIVATREAPPFSFKTESGEWTGITIELWEAVAKELGYDYEYQEYALGDMLDKVAKDEVQVGAAAITVTAERVIDMDFTHTYYGTGLGIASSSEKDNLITDLFKRIFTLNFFKALVALLAVILAAGFLIWLVERKRNAEQFGGRPLSGLGNGFWWSAVTMTTVGYGDRAPVTFWGRAIGFAWMFTSILIISGFTGAIATALTMGQITSNQITLATLPKVKTGVLDDSAAQAFLESRGMHPAVYASVSEGLEAVNQGKIKAFIHDQPILKYWAARDYPERIEVSAQTFNPGYLALAVPHDSQYEHDIDVAMLEYIQSPAWNSILKKYNATSGQ